MHSALKAVFFVMIFAVFSTSVCYAKIIYDRTGRISVEAGYNWETVTLGGDTATIELFSVAGDKDTALKFTKSSFPMIYASMYDMTEFEKSVLLDRLISDFKSYMNYKGYIVTSTSKSIDSYTVSYTCSGQKNGKEIFFTLICSIKQSCLYSVSLICTQQGVRQIFDVFSSLRIDGLPFFDWAKIY